MEDHADGLLARALWTCLARAGRGPCLRPARAAAAIALRLSSRTPAGYRRSMLRVATRTPAPLQRLTRLPTAWWIRHPLVRVRRLGLHLDLDLRDNLQRTLYFTGRYEPALLALLLAELRPGDVVLDVGAHIGVHALPVARRLRGLGGGRVIAVEPTPDSAAALRRAAERHRLPVTVARTALGRAPGEVTIRTDPDYGSADAGVRSQFTCGPAVATAPVAALDDWVAAHGLDRLDVVKIDVEGAEPDVLAGAAATLCRLQPRLVVVEVKDRILHRAGVPPEAVDDAVRTPLREAGYVRWGVADGNEVWRRDRR